MKQFWFNLNWQGFVKVDQNRLKDFSGVILSSYYQSVRKPLSHCSTSYGLTPFTMVYSRQEEERIFAFTHEPCRRFCSVAVISELSRPNVNTLRLPQSTAGWTRRKLLAKRWAVCLFRAWNYVRKKANRESKINLMPRKLSGHAFVMMPQNLLYRSLANTSTVSSDSWLKWIR